jgi:hypothetical protein
LAFLASSFPGLILELSRDAWQAKGCAVLVLKHPLFASIALDPLRAVIHRPTPSAAFDTARRQRVVRPACRALKTKERALTGDLAVWAFVAIIRVIVLQSKIPLVSVEFSFGTFLAHDRVDVVARLEPTCVADGAFCLIVHKLAPFVALQALRLEEVLGSIRASVVKQIFSLGAPGAADRINVVLGLKSSCAADGAR